MGDFDEGPCACCFFQRPKRPPVPKHKGPSSPSGNKLANEVGLASTAERQVPADCALAASAAAAAVMARSSHKELSGQEDFLRASVKEVHSQGPHFRSLAEQSGSSVPDHELSSPGSALASASQSVRLIFEEGRASAGSTNRSMQPSRATHMTSPALASRSKMKSVDHDLDCLQMLNNALAGASLAEVTVKEILRPFSTTTGSLYRGVYDNNNVTIRVIPLPSKSAEVVYETAAAAAAAPEEPEHSSLGEYLASLAAKIHTNLAQLYFTKVQYVSSPVEEAVDYAEEMRINEEVGVHPEESGQRCSARGTANSSQFVRFSLAEDEKQDSIPMNRLDAKGSGVLKERMSVGSKIMSYIVHPGASSDLSTPLGSLVAIRKRSSVNDGGASANMELATPFRKAGEPRSGLVTTKDLASMGSKNLQSMLAQVTALPMQEPINEKLPSLIQATKSFEADALFSHGAAAHQLADPILESMYGAPSPLQPSTLVGRSPLPTMSGKPPGNQSQPLSSLHFSLNGNALRNSICFSLSVNAAPILMDTEPKVAESSRLRKYSHGGCNLYNMQGTNMPYLGVRNSSQGSTNGRLKGIINSVYRIMSQESKEGTSSPTSAPSTVWPKTPSLVRMQKFTRQCRLIMIQEECDFSTLSRALINQRFFFTEHGLPRMEMVAEIAKEICSALLHLHACGIVAGSLSSDTILLQRESASLSGFTVKLADYGLHGTKLERPSETAPSCKFYMDPESSESGEATKAGDVYSFGVVLWELYHSQSAWVAVGNTSDITCTVLRPEFPNFPPDSPKEYADLVESCLGSASTRPSIRKVAHRLHNLKKGILQNMAGLFLQLGLSPPGSVRSSLIGAEDFTSLSARSYVSVGSSSLGRSISTLNASSYPVAMINEDPDFPAPPLCTLASPASRSTDGVYRQRSKLGRPSPDFVRYSSVLASSQVAEEEGLEADQPVARDRDLLEPRAVLGRWHTISASWGLHGDLEMEGAKPVAGRRPATNAFYYGLAPPQAKVSTWSSDDSLIVRVPTKRPVAKPAQNAIMRTSAAMRNVLAIESDRSTVSSRGSRGSRGSQSSRDIKNLAAKARHLAQILLDQPLASARRDGMSLLEGGGLSREASASDIMNAAITVIRSTAASGENAHGTAAVYGLHPLSNHAKEQAPRQNRQEST